jgi:hypothetical protein
LRGGWHFNIPRLKQIQTAGGRMEREFTNQKKIDVEKKQITNKSPSKNEERCAML